jgi:hypothetical protein
MEHIADPRRTAPMLKLAALSLLVCAGGLSGFYASALHRAPAGSDTDPAAAPQISSIETDLLAAPSIAEGSLKGFFFLRLVYEVDAREASKLGVGLNLIAADSFYDFLMRGKAAFSIHDSGDMQTLTHGLQAAANELAGLPLVKQIYLAQADFFAGDEARKASVERRKLLKADDGKKPEPAPAAH